MIRRSAQAPAIRHPRLAVRREEFFFFEKNTGVAHFCVASGMDGRFPVDEAAGLLAMHCLVRNQNPSDYVVLVEADSGPLKRVNQRAQMLLEAGRALKTHAILTRREQAVLYGVVRCLANKEIGAALNLSERTVKFHVSSLLTKFRVRGRMDLMQEAAQHVAPAMPFTKPAATREARAFLSRRDGLPQEQLGPTGTARGPAAQGAVSNSAKVLCAHKERRKELRVLTARLLRKQAGVNAAFS